MFHYGIHCQWGFSFYTGPVGFEPGAGLDLQAPLFCLRTSALTKSWLGGALRHCGAWDDSFHDAACQVNSVFSLLAKPANDLFVRSAIMIPLGSQSFLALLHIEKPPLGTGRNRKYLDRIRLAWPGTVDEALCWECRRLRRGAI